jgi:hypothetical protein
MNANRNNRRRNQPRTNRIPRLPRSITSNAPFSVGRNKQLVSIPSHADGLTVQRSVRLNMAVGTPGPNTNVTYADVLARFRGELNITVTADGRISFSPEWVSFYHIASSGFSGAAMRIFDEPRSNTTAGAFVNTPYYEALDSSSLAGVVSIKARIPKAATYTISSDDPANLLALPFLGFGIQTAGQVFIDVGGTWTIKSITGATFVSA